MWFENKQLIYGPFVVTVKFKAVVTVHGMSFVCICIDLTIMATKPVLFGGSSNTKQSHKLVCWLWPSWLIDCCVFNLYSNRKNVTNKKEEVFKKIKNKK